MIKCDKGVISVKGRPIECFAELSCIVRELYELVSDLVGEERAREDIMNAVEAGFRDIEDIKEENRESEECVADMLDMLADLLRGKDRKENEDGSK
ncbi:MAG: hypothetical protein IKU44_04360 [Firmicutes bacterium]|nr:hypothetical protein [Bacillota bacterium]